MDCEECGAAIPIGRLQAIPGATLCVTCKEVEERDFPRRHRMDYDIVVDNEDVVTEPRIVRAK